MCLALRMHTLQLAINNGLNLSQVSRVTAAPHKLVGHSVCCHNYLEWEAATNVCPSAPSNSGCHHKMELNLFQPISTYFMIERLTGPSMLCSMTNKLSSCSVGAYFSRSTADNWTVGESARAFAGATTALCEAETVSVSLVYPVIWATPCSQQWRPVGSKTF